MKKRTRRCSGQTCCGGMPGVVLASHCLKSSLRSLSQVCLDYMRRGAREIDLYCKSFWAKRCMLVRGSASADSTSHSLALRRRILSCENGLHVMLPRASTCMATVPSPPSPWHARSEGKDSLGGVPGSYIAVGHGWSGPRSILIDLRNMMFF